MSNDHDIIIRLDTKMDNVDKKICKLDKKLDDVLIDVGCKEAKCNKRNVSWPQFLGVITLFVAIVAVVIVF